MRFALTQEEQDKLLSIGCPGVGPEIDVDPEEYGKHYEEWQKQVPLADHDVWNLKAIAAILWQGAVPIGPAGPPERPFHDIRVEQQKMERKVDRLKVQIESAHEEVKEGNLERYIAIDGILNAMRRWQQEAQRKTEERLLIIQNDLNTMQSRLEAEREQDNVETRKWRKVVVISLLVILFIFLGASLLRAQTSRLTSIQFQDEGVAIPGGFFAYPFIINCAGAGVACTAGASTITLTIAGGGGAAHNLLSATHTDTVAASPVLGDILYGNVTPAWTKLAGNTTTTKNFLTQTGTGAVSAVPAWSTVLDADIPAAIARDSELPTVFYHTVQNESIGLTQRRILNFLGLGVDCVDDAVDSTDCTIAGGGGNSFGTIGTAVADAGADTLTITDSLSIDITTTDAPEDLTAAFRYDQTQAGNPALAAENCIFTTDGTGGGGLLCEGTTADTNEGLIQWNPTTDKILTLPDATDTLVGRDTTDTLINKTLAAASNVIDADTAVALAANGGNCAANNFALGVDASGVGECAQPAFSNLSGQASDTQIADGAVDGGTGGEIADGTVDSNDLATANKTDTRSFTLFEPVTGDSGRIQWEPGRAITITRVYCSVKAATSVTLNLDKRTETTPDTAGTDVLSAGLVCDTNAQTSCAAGCDVNTITSAGVTARQIVATTISAVTGTPDTLRVVVEFTTD